MRNWIVSKTELPKPINNFFTELYTFVPLRSLATPIVLFPLRLMLESFPRKKSVRQQQQQLRRRRQQRWGNHSTATAPGESRFNSHEREREREREREKDEGRGDGRCMRCGWWWQWWHEQSQAVAHHHVMNLYDVERKGIIKCIHEDIFMGAGKSVADTIVFVFW